ncbi:MAG: hypothetical protein HGJ97_03610 [Desulfosporosinus sp.]|nr:hypothetical protein [Desulfosporosinus sp.]
MNAQHIKAVPGRKTDVKDSEWIADLLRHGLLVGNPKPTLSCGIFSLVIRKRKI